MLTEFWKRCSDPLNRKPYGSPGVSHLFFSGGPPAISRLISFHVVDSINAESFGFIAHIFQKILKTKPAVADRNTSRSVILKGFFIWICASFNHSGPRSVSPRGSFSVRSLLCNLGVSVCGHLKFHQFIMQAPARSSVATGQNAVEYSHRNPTLALANALSGCSPVWMNVIRSISDYFKSSKGLSDDVDFSGHGIGSFSVVSSGECRTQPASLQNCLINCVPGQG